MQSEGTSGSGSVREGTALDALLEPSLAQAGPSAPLYSVRANFMVAFFGGVYATLAFSWLNTLRVGRAREDAWLHLVLAAAWTAAVYWIGHVAALGETPSWLSLTGDRVRDVRYVSRAASLLVYGLLYLRLRRFHTAAVLSGQLAPNPWKAGLAAVVAGTVLTWLVNVLAASTL